MEMLSKQVWPSLFQITPLAQLIIGFVPKIQVRTWVKRSSGMLQSEICMWMPTEDIDNAICESIFKTDNELCVHHLKKKHHSLWIPLLLIHPIPKLLPLIINQIPSFCDLFIDKRYVKTNIPLCNLKVFVHHPKWDSECNNVFIVHSVSAFESDPQHMSERLLWMLSVHHQKTEIGHVVGNKFIPELWNVIAPFVQCGQLTMRYLSTHYLSTMTLDAFCQIPPVWTDMRRAIFETSLQNRNFIIAEHVWQTEFETTLSANLTFLINHYVYADYGLINVSKFVCHYVILQTESSCKHAPLLNDVLQFIDSKPIVPGSNATFKDAICNFVWTFIMMRPFHDILWIFERACFKGYFHIVSLIWRLHASSKQDELQTKLNACRFSSNKDMLTFAWSVISDEIRADVFEWTRAAFNNNNVTLWCLLIKWKILPLAGLFEAQIDDSNSSLDTINVVQALGRKPVALLEAVWNMKGVQNPNNVNQIYFEALYKSRADVLGFLNLVNIPLSQSLTCTYFQLLSYLKLTNILSQLTSPLPRQLMLSMNSYFEHYDVPEVLWKLAPLDHAQFLNFLQDHTPNFPMCIAMLNRNVLSIQTLMDALRNQPKPNHTLLNALQEHTYCFADEL